MILLFLSAATWLAAATSATPQSDAPPAATIAVGDPLVDASRVPPYRARWKLILQTGGSKIVQGDYTEEMRLREVDGSSVLRQVQHLYPTGGGQATRTEIDFHPRTLIPLRMKTVVGDSATEVVYDWNRLLATTWQGGIKTTQPLLRPCFDATRIGLVVAALPLDEGFRIRMPFGPMAPYWWITVRVVGFESFDPGDGMAREAWIVETDWEQEDREGDIYMGDFKGGGGGGGTWRILKSVSPGNSRVASVSFFSGGSYTWISMEDGLDWDGRPPA